MTTGALASRNLAFTTGCTSSSGIDGQNTPAYVSWPRDPLYTHTWQLRKSGTSAVLQSGSIAAGTGTYTITIGYASGYTNGDYELTVVRSLTSTPTWTHTTTQKLQLSTSWIFWRNFSCVS